MLGFLKVFVQGILYVVLLPVILAILAFYAVYTSITFIYMAIKSIVIFFMGGTPMGDLPEDVEAKRILMEKEDKIERQQEVNQNLTNALVQTQLQMAELLKQQGFQQETSEQQEMEEMEEPYEPVEDSSLESPQFDDELEEINDD